MIRFLFICTVAVLQVSAGQKYVPEAGAGIFNELIMPAIAHADTVPVLPDTLSEVLIPEFPDTIPTDTLEHPDVQPETEEEEEELEIVDIWPDLTTPGFHKQESDSTLRWDLVLNWPDRYYRQPGVITYRTGRLGQPVGLNIYSYEDRHQRLNLDELDLTDPITGQTNWNRLPTHKIRHIEMNDHSYTHRSRVMLRELYVVEPRTFLNFDEGQDDHRNLEFAFTHNFSAQTNVELSFWDRRDGDLYPRNRMEGRQIVGRFRHHLNDRTKIKGGYINNSLDHQQPFGYNIPDLKFFNFNPFNVAAMESNASSVHGTNDFYLKMVNRPEEDKPASRATGLTYQSDKWDLSYSADTTAYSLRDIGIFGWQEYRPGNAKIRASADAHLMKERAGRSFTSDNWLLWNAGIEADLPFSSWLGASLNARYTGRNDDRTGYEISGSLRLQPGRWLRLKGFGGVGSSIPDLQSLYWDSEEFTGNSLLSNESAVFSGGSVEIDLGSRITIGTRGDIREVQDGIFLNDEETFINIDSYTTLSGSAWLALNSSRFEGDLSATYHRFSSGSANIINQRLHFSGERTWLKGSLYWKNSVFDEAAFVKAGLAGMFNPGNYMPAEYLVPLNRWQHGREQRVIPNFHRLDVEVMARIRWFMLQVRYENALDAITQLGYFESDAYPMPRGRLMVGFRIVFTN